MCNAYFMLAIPPYKRFLKFVLFRLLKARFLLQEKLRQSVIVQYALGFPL